MIYGMKIRMANVVLLRYSLVGYCGVELSEIDETQVYALKDLQQEPTDVQMAIAKLKVINLHPELRKLAGDIGVYLVWSSS